MGPLAKYSALVGAIIANLIVYGLLAIFFARRSNRTPQSYLLNSLSCAIISFVIFLSLTIVLLALTEGQAQSISILSLASYLIIPQLSFGFTLYAVLYKRGHEPVIEDPKMIRNLKPSSEEQIDQPKRQMLRAGIVCRSRNTSYIPRTRKPSFPSAGSSEHKVITIVSISAEVEEHQTKRL